MRRSDTQLPMEDLGVRKTTEVEYMAFELADETARCDIESECIWLTHSGKYAGRWYELVENEYVARAVKYLDLRKLLVRHPENPSLVRFAN